MNRSYEGFRILLVHAHPDDETINNGATMALYADRGAHVTLVTCTRGEEGEVLVPALSHLSSSEKDQLGAHREIELAGAMKVRNKTIVQMFFGKLMLMLLLTSWLKLSRRLNLTY
jgi:N-acetyl-1-D-myo-inositol-2-amino-2-deoxy-alpha-D-glucopyranoside deacetylase